MKPRTTYTEEAAAHAKVLIENGWSNKAIKAVDVCADIPFSMLRQWRYRIKTANETPAGNDKTLKRNAKTLTELAMIEGNGNPLFTVENSVTGVSPALQSVSEKRGFILLGAVFFSTIATACIGAFHLMGWWFLLPCVPYALISVDAFLTATDPEMSKIAERGRTVVIILELIASVSNHSLFNSIFWANIERLPVHIVREGNLILVGDTAPSYAAGFVAFAMFCGAFYAVDTTILKAKNRGVK